MHRQDGLLIPLKHASPPQIIDEIFGRHPSGQANDAAQHARMGVGSLTKSTYCRGQHIQRLHQCRQQGAAYRDRHVSDLGRKSLPCLVHGLYPPLIVLIDGSHGHGLGRAHLPLVAWVLVPVLPHRQQMVDGLHVLKDFVEPKALHQLALSLFIAALARLLPLLGKRLALRVDEGAVNRSGAIHTLCFLVRYCGSWSNCWSRFRYASMRQ